ncbi:hypothetical protein EKO27_g4110 [Xylaria grammica]|uniref:FAD-binding FR-type domain-containing protein n=1 Tax=Xylaria grammica TaxID=363999 RepID=A0A439D993_9PEZI|nr:hypothetical protein EKO27_g4110 [Xylaria grammica]
MRGNAMRWLGRLRGPSRAAQSFFSYDHSRVIFRRLYRNPTPAGRPSQNSPLSRALCSSSKLQLKATPSDSESAPSDRTQPSTTPQTRNSHPRGPRWMLLVLIFATSAGSAYLYRRQSAAIDDDVINTSTFTAFTITEREQVSPTAFIITLRPGAWVVPRGLGSGCDEEDDEPVGFLSNRIRDAWRHGLWSVEIKQPQLQIARHYTPLPPLPISPSSPSMESKGTSENGNVSEAQAMRSGKAGRVTEDQDEQADLRILVRRMDGGEMSNYLSRQRVGDTLWLRGPHLGFDVPRRIGDGGAYDNGTGMGDVGAQRVGGQRGVVFLAGGTGIAPALQIAHKLLDDNGYSESAESRPHISILWANRCGADALGCEKFPALPRKSGNWFRFWDRPGTDCNAALQKKRKQLTEEPASSLALQIQDLKRRHPSHFEISYFADDEGSFIKAHDVEAALASAVKRLSPCPDIHKDCTWHSQGAVELLPDDNDVSRFSSPDPACACICALKAGLEATAARPGVNLVCLSGPDGFIEAYAGAKRWHDGNEMQGAIRGLLGVLKKEKGKKDNDWLVLKL